ncbi:MAG: hypothetical protein EOO99_01285 [Pedobacter sp.]|nr:MAG: hypothetical protein EOO99_01285 [Pedobacter sp.]
MDAITRKLFNENFSKANYENFLAQLNQAYRPIPFRVAESPFFISEDLKKKLISAGEEILAFIKQPSFKSITNAAIPPQWNVPNENDHPHFICLDFGICEMEDGSLEPQLIELQGFPSLFGFQHLLAETFLTYYHLSSEWRTFTGVSADYNYFKELSDLITGDCKPSEVIMLDIKPHKQKTAIDFEVTACMLGLKILGIEEVQVEGLNLYYKEDHELKPIRRIYNRLIFDELAQLPSTEWNMFDPRTSYNVEWITHPNWFYRISKFLLPYLKSRFVPSTRFLSEFSNYPKDLENYVLKPLFSFAGQGVIINPVLEDLTGISDPKNWILQKKVKYAPVLKSPTGDVKVEVRLMYTWADNSEPQLVMNLTRHSKGEMIGVRYNDQLDWVGGSVSFMKKQSS